jgi:hypothetical protein
MKISLLIYLCFDANLILWAGARTGSWLLVHVTIWSRSDNPPSHVTGIITVPVW